MSTTPRCDSRIEKADPGRLSPALDVVILGLSLRSAWGNGHATTWRALVGALQQRGHRVTFLERDVPWYSDHADPPDELPVQPLLYENLAQLQDEHAARVAAADLVIVGSYVPDGIAVCDWVLRRAGAVTAFYDIDTPVTLARLAREDCDYLHPAQIARFDIHFSFSGGRALYRLQQTYGAQRPIALYCAFDGERYKPDPDVQPTLDLGYMGTYSDDRQPTLQRLLLDVARDWPQGQFAVAGPQYPDNIEWPSNVQRTEHLPPSRHRDFYTSQRFTLNVTRADMIELGHSPSVRLFEAAACATPVISDNWPGLAELFEPGVEILIAKTGAQVRGWLQDTDENARRRIGEAARRRVLAEHTAAHRARTVEQAFSQVERNRPSQLLARAEA